MPVFATSAGLWCGMFWNWDTEMLTSPYKIILVPPVSREPSDEQQLWMLRRLQMLAKSAVSMGLGGDCVHMDVYPMQHHQKILPHWASHWRRPEHCQVDLLRGVVGWNTTKWEVGYLARNCAHEIIAKHPDEVWCFNEFGHGQYSNCAGARIWRELQTFPTLAARFKLVPSWVNSDAPEKPAKEKSDAKANGNKRSSSAPASDAGGERGKRVAKGPARSPWGVPRTRY